MATTPDSTLARYSFDSVAPAHTEAYLWKPILAACRRLDARRVLDLGCGNGAFCKALLDAGFEVAGCDPSEDGIRLAAEACPGVTFRQMSVDDDPAALGGGFDIVVSTEVVEHLVAPRNLPAFAAKVLRPGGHLIVSTPYHGYWKNLVLSLANRWDDHWTPFWDGGHIKFWSRKTLTWLLEGEGFRVTAFIGAGRVPYLWKSMILVARKTP